MRGMFVGACVEGPPTPIDTERGRRSPSPAGDATHALQIGNLYMFRDVAIDDAIGMSPPPPFSISLLYIPTHKLHTHTHTDPSPSTRTHKPRRHSTTRTSLVPLAHSISIEKWPGHFYICMDLHAHKDIYICMGPQAHKQC
jgi:hypothetical protein